MSADVSYYRIGLGVKVHAFRIRHDPEHGARFLVALCGRYAGTASTIRQFCSPWIGDDFPPDDLMCKRCLEIQTRCDGRGWVSVT